MAEVELEDFTEQYWKQLKKAYGIKSAGFFESAEKKNNIGPSLSAYHSSRKALGRKASKTEFQVYLRAAERLDKGIMQLLGGNREVDGSFQDIKALGKQLQALHQELQASIRGMKDILSKQEHVDNAIKQINERNASDAVKFWKSKGIL